jgi:RNA polymerase sigma-70 factor (ECF subfamily)
VRRLEGRYVKILDRLPAGAPTQRPAHGCVSRSPRRIVFPPDIVARLHARDESAFRELYDVAWDGLLAIAAGIIQSRDAAEDVVQDVIFRVWQRGNQLDPDVSLADYLVTAVRNSALSALRDDARLRQRHGGFADELALQQLPSLGSPAETALEWEEELAELRRVLTTLTEHQRTAFTLRYGLGMTNQAIAEQLGISLKGAEQLTARLKRLLRERFRQPM